MSEHIDEKQIRFVPGGAEAEEGLEVVMYRNETVGVIQPDGESWKVVFQDGTVAKKQSKMAAAKELVKRMIVY